MHSQLATRLEADKQLDTGTTAISFYSSCFSWLGSLRSMSSQSLVSVLVFSDVRLLETDLQTSLKTPHPTPLRPNGHSAKSPQHCAEPLLTTLSSCALLYGQLSNYLGLLSLLYRNYGNYRVK